MQGQINLDDEAGLHIKNICEREDVSTIVEIGTWNGRGSTFCIYESIKNTEKRLISLETWKEMYDFAFSFYKDKKEVSIINGYVSDKLLDFHSLDDSFFTDYDKNLKLSWYNEDLKNINNCKNVLDQIPEKIDFLILDGGEYSSWDEYLILKDRSRIIFLDDTRPPTIKNFMARENLLKTRKAIVDDLYARNGYCIFEK
jgi:predicted O-methyltransferase YrrM